MPRARAARHRGGVRARPVRTHARAGRERAGRAGRRHVGHGSARRRAGARPSARGAARVSLLHARASAPPPSAEGADRPEASKMPVRGRALRCSVGMRHGSRARQRSMLLDTTTVLECALVGSVAAAWRASAAQALYVATKNCVHGRPGGGERHHLHPSAPPPPPAGAGAAGHRPALWIANVPVSNNRAARLRSAPATVHHPAAQWRSISLRMICVPGLSLRRYCLRSAPATVHHPAAQWRSISLRMICVPGLSLRRYL